MTVSTKTNPQLDSFSSRFDVFISYSRRDKTFVQTLVMHLKEAGYIPWIDWNDIPPLAQWRDEIRQGIVAADYFLYVISPDTIKSVECDKELDCAIAHNKQLVPIVYKDVDSKFIHSAIAKINWIFFRETDDFDLSLTRLVKALQTDLVYVRTHTRLLTKADEWLYNRQDSSLLLRGASLEIFERWATQAVEKNPVLTSQQRQYLFTSRQVESARQKQEIRQQRLALGVISSLLALVVILGIRTEIRRREAIIGEMRALSAASTATMAQDQPFDSLLQSMHAGKLLQQAWWLNKPEVTYTVQSALGNAVYRTQEINRLEGHRDWIYGLSISPQGESLVSASLDGTIKLWNRTGQLTKSIDSAHDSKPIRKIHYSPDGQLIASVGDDRQIRLWTALGEPVRNFEAHLDMVTSVSFSPDGNILASGSIDDTVRLWHLDGRLKAELTEHTGNVQQVAFSPDGQLLASASFDGTVRLWQADGTPITKLEHPSADSDQRNWVIDVAFSPDGETIASATSNGLLYLWQRDGTPITSFPAHDGMIKAIHFSPDGQLIASAGSDRIIKLWRHSNQQLVTTLLGHQDELQALIFTPDGNIVASAGRDKKIRLWNRDLSFFQQYRQHIGDVNSINIHPDTGQWISSSSDGTARIWKSATETIPLGRVSNRQVYQAAISPSGQHIATVGFDGETQAGFLELWTGQGQFVRAVGAQHGRWTISAAFDASSQIIAAATDNGDINLWQLDGTLVHTLAYDDMPQSVIFSPDGKQIAVTGNTGIKVWDSKEYKLLYNLDYRAGLIQANYSPDGTMLAFAANDNIVGLWPLGGSSYETLDGHQGGVNSVQFSPDGTQLVSAGADKVIRLWEVRTKSLIVELSGHTSTVNDVKFSQDSTKLLSVSSDDTLIEWDLSILNLDTLMAIGCEQIQDYLQTNSKVQSADKTLCR